MNLLASLPMSNGVWSIFETIESTAILDRIESSGLYVGEAGLMGVRGSSWTQADWQLGEFDITDPDRTGTPLFFADPEALAGVEISAGLAPADVRGAGPGSSSCRDGPTACGGRRSRSATRPRPSSRRLVARERPPSRTSIPSPAPASASTGRWSPTASAP